MGEVDVEEVDVAVAAEVVADNLYRYMKMIK